MKGSNDNELLTQDETWAMWNRFDGPVPQQYTQDSLARELRLRKGELAVYERRLADCLVSAEYAEDELEWLTRDGADPARAEKIRHHAAVRTRAIADGAALLQRIGELRGHLNRPLHPLLAIARTAEQSDMETDTRQLRLAV